MNFVDQAAFTYAIAGNEVSEKWKIFAGFDPRRLTLQSVDGISHRHFVDGGAQPPQPIR